MALSTPAPAPSQSAAGMQAHATTQRSGPGHVAPGGHGHHDEQHLPHGSWWPFWLALAMSLFGLGLIMLGRALNMDGGAPSTVPPVVAFTVLGIGLVALLGTLLGWWREDFKWWNENVGTGNHIPKAGTLLFIGSEVFLFGGLFATYLTFKGLSGGHWPDGEHTHLPVLKTLIFSVFLFASSWTVHKAEHAIKHGDRLTFQRWWWATIVLGAIFLGGQVWEYSNLIAEGETLGSSQFITAFYMLTGTHGLHVFGGLVLLTIVGVRAAKGQFTKERHVLPQCASMYWHFVDIVWVVVFSVLYLAEFPLFG
jgi:cytochrome c oxidase subunit III